MTDAISKLPDAVQARLDGEYSAEDLETKEKWDTAGDWPTLLDLNCQYLRGELDFTSYYAGPIHAETKPMVPGLLSLHEYGLLTIESQIGGYTEGPSKTKCPCCDKIEWCLSKQRAFLTLLAPPIGEFVTEEQLDKFMLGLLKHEDFYASVLGYKKFCDRGGCRVGAKNASSFPEDWEAHLQKRSPKKQNLDTEDWQPRQHIELECTCILDAFKISKDVCPLVINVLAKGWDDVDLIGLVLEVAEDCGLDKIFDAAV